MLADAIQAAGMTRLAFADKAGCSPSLVTEVIQGVRKPPLRHLDRWAELLLVSPEARLVFVRHGALTHAPAIVRSWIEELQLESATHPTGTVGLDGA